MALSNKLKAFGQAILVNSTLTTSIIRLAGPIKVYRIYQHAAVAKTTGTALVLTVQSEAGITPTALGTYTSPDTIAIGTTTYKEFNPPLAVAEGRWCQVASTTAGNDGSSLVWIEYGEEPSTKAYLDTIVAGT